MIPINRTGFAELQKKMENQESEKVSKAPCRRENSCSLLWLHGCERMLRFWCHSFVFLFWCVEQSGNNDDTQDEDESDEDYEDSDDDDEQVDDEEYSDEYDDDEGEDESEDGAE